MGKMEMITTAVIMITVGAFLGMWARSDYLLRQWELERSAKKGQKRARL